MQIYLVGGALRDMLLGLPERDRDFVWFGEPADLLALLPEARPVGKTFPIYLHHGREYAPGRGPDIDADLADRDLTINAIALAVHGQTAGQLRMHPLALHDLRHRWLRPASPSAFRDDPLRVFRAARFAVQLPDFRIHAATVAAMREVAALGLLDTLDAERVGVEVQKALAAPPPATPGRFLEVLDLGGCLAPWFSPLDRAATIPAGPAAYHGANSVLQHTINVMNAVHRAGGDGMAVWLAMCHDLGKCVSPELRLPRHHGHELHGLPLARALAERLRLSNRHIKAAEVASLHHMKLGGYAQLRPGTRVDLLAALQPTRLLEPMLLLAQADRSQVGLGESYAEAMDHIREDMRRMQAVRLPDNLRNKGPESGRLLREMRCQALCKRDRCARADCED
ncbi:HD domain-containing protein [Megalodesulfovibrio paquesii]